MGSVHECRSSAQDITTENEHVSMHPKETPRSVDNAPKHATLARQGNRVGRDGARQMDSSGWRRTYDRRHFRNLVWRYLERRGSPTDRTGDRGDLRILTDLVDYEGCTTFKEISKKVDCGSRFRQARSKKRSHYTTININDNVYKYKKQSTFEIEKD